MTRTRPLLALATLALSASVALPASVAWAGPTLDAVKKRGELVCGSNPGIAGFGLPDDKGQWKGFDIEFCRAVAATIFNDASKVRFTPLSAKDRFTALQSGEIDVLSRNTTWTQSREVGQGFLFGAVTYYDGQGFMVRKKLNVNSAMELSGASVCVQQGTTTELNLADFFRTHNMKYELVVFATADEALKAYDTGRCDSFTTDMSQLYGERTKLGNPEDHVIMPEVISKEPLGPTVRQGDDQWFNLVKWTHYAMVTAEELGVTQANVDEKLKAANPEIKRLLGTEGNFGAGLGLTQDWAYRIVKLVGNYGEVFERNVGANSKLKIQRGLNALWNAKGLQYAPPIR
ncbi:MAG: amino acid ABC transporter substrate-binding protein [Rhodoblastus sp.]